MRKVIKGLGLSLLILSGVFCLFSCNDEIIPPVIEATPSVRGTISLPASSGLFPEDIWVKVVENETTKYVGRVNPDATFSVSGLDAAKKYDVMFTSIEPEQQNVSRGFESRAASTTNGFGGWLSDVSASIDEANIGSVKIKPLGTINGKAIRSGAVDNYDVMVYIPGTSFMAMSNEDGSFSIANVPQGTHRLRYTSDDYMSQMKEKVLLFSDDDTVNPVTTVSDVILIKNAGILKGYATLNGAASNAGIIIKLEGDNATGSEIGTTASDGSFSIPDVKPGIYSALFSYAGYIDQKVENLVIEAAKTTSLPSSVSLIANGGTITGTVRQNDGTAGTGASVMAKVTIGEADFTYSSTVDADGKFTLNDCRPADGYSITVSKTGFASVVRSGISLTVEGIILPEIELSSEFGGLSGYVQDSEMNAINGAQINIGDYTAFTNSEGYFIKSDLPLGQYMITVSKDGYGTLTLATAVSVESSETTSIGITKLKSLYGSLTGNIKLQGIEDYSGILITVSGSQTYTASTTIDGSYSIPALLPGTYSVILSKAGFVSTTITDVVITADTNTIVAENVLVSSSCGISGRVVLEGSTGNAGAIVSASYVGDSSKVYSTTTLEDGTYSFTGLDAGQYSMKMQMTGFVTDNSQLITTAYGEVSLVPNVTLKSVTSTVNGNVTLSGSIDHAGINVLLKATDESWQYDVTTDQSGAYTITKVQPGVYDLYASKSGYETKTVEDITIEPTSTKTIDSMNLAVAIRSITGSVELELRTDHSGALITATKVTDPTKVYSAISNSAGNYTLAGMEPGEYGIVITSAGYRTMTLPTTDVVANSTAILSKTSLLIARGTISGIVTSEGRSSQEGTKVELLGTEYLTTTNALGEYSFYVPQGNYPGGIRFTKLDFKADSHTDTIPVLTDSVYAVPNTELKATHVSIYGTVEVQGADDDSAVTVSFDNSTHIETVVTDATGAFRFDHVVLGNHTLRFKRDKTPDVTVLVAATPSDGMNVGTVVLTPNSASIHGIVRLKDATSYSGVKVEVDVQDMGKISTFTGAGGDYYIGGIYSIGTHTVTFSKNGWDSQSTTVSGLVPLEDREMGEVTLIDTTAPVLNSLTINSGANTVANNVVTLHVDATELGSGISKMQISYDNVFDQTVTMRDYSSSFSWELPSGNGLKTIYMKLYDASGNASNVASASVTLIDQKKEVWGVLTGEDLHWTKEMSPYLVTGNIMVESDKTLTIDSGVDVQFPGAYSLTIEGTLRAIGTETEKISFYGIDNAEWNGINGVNDAENRLSHVSMTHLREGIQGYVDIDHSVISSASGYVLGASSYDREFRGTARENEIVGKIRTNEASLLRNNIQDEGANFERTFLSGNEFSGGNSTIEIRYSLGENNKFEGKTLTLQYSGMINSTFTSCNLSIAGGGLHTRNSYSDCNFIDFSPTKLINSNLIGCGLITMDTPRSNYEEIDMTGNFWGYDKTSEMTEKGISANLSFIHDYYDDFSKTKVVYSSYRNEPLSGVGYLGDSYYPFAAESPTVYGIGDTGPAGGLVFFDKGFYSEGWRYLEAAPADLDGSIIFGCYKATSNSTIQISGTATGIGSGRTNTRMLVETMGDQAYRGTREADYAAKLCGDYESNGYADWFLPSKDELNQMYRNLYLNNRGGFSDGTYWSSSEVYDYNAWYQLFGGGGQGTNYRDYELRVRPVRAF